MKKILLLLTLLASFNAYAIDPAIKPTKTLNCSMPIEREDGTPLALNEIAEIRFYSGNAPGDYSLPEQSNNVCQLVIDTTQLLDNTYYYVMSAVDTEGRLSLYSSEKVFTVKRVKPPKPPSWLE